MWLGRITWVFDGCDGREMSENSPCQAASIRVGSRLNEAARMSRAAKQAKLQLSRSPSLPPSPRAGLGTEPGFSLTKPQWLNNL